jgi:transporter family protein
MARLQLDRMRDTMGTNLQPSAIGNEMENWQTWAIASAIFASLTAIFAKIGIEGLNSDFATFIRTCVIIVVLAGFLTLTSQWQPFGAISGRSLLFLILSGLATGASWISYFRALKLGQAAQVAPVDKLSVVLVAIFATTFLGEHLSKTHWLGVVMVASGAVLLAIQV